MTLENFQNDLKQAQLGRDEVRVSTLRLLISELKNLQIQKGTDLDEPDVLSVLKKEIKKRQESIQMYQSGGRDELAAKEQQELDVLKAYLPEQLSTEELTKIVEDTINELGAKTLSDMGRVIGQVLAKSAGKADGGEVSKIAREKLTAN